MQGGGPGAVGKAACLQTREIVGSGIQVSKKQNVSLVNIHYRASMTER